MRFLYANRRQLRSKTLYHRQQRVVGPAHEFSGRHAPGRASTGSPPQGLFRLSLILGRIGREARCRLPAKRRFDRNGPGAGLVAPGPFPLRARLGRTPSYRENLATRRWHRVAWRPCIQIRQGRCPGPRQTAQWPLRGARVTGRQQRNNQSSRRLYSALNSHRVPMTECDGSTNEFPDPERRAQLRRDTLLLARRFPPGPERNALRLTAKSLTFFHGLRPGTECS